MKCLAARMLIFNILLYVLRLIYIISYSLEVGFIDFILLDLRSDFYLVYWVTLPLLDILFVPPNVHAYLNVSIFRVVIFYQHILLTLLRHCCCYPELCSNIPVFVY